MHLIIDIGNTLQKLAVFNENEKMVHWMQKDRLTIPMLDAVLSSKDQTIESAIVSSVGKDDEELLLWLGKRVKLVRFTHDCRLPIVIRYETPKTLGTDRIANAVGANALYPEKNVLSIMAGTCLVADFVDATGQYWGGRIAPGMRMRFQALAQFTARLPLVEPEPIYQIVGDSTKSSILTGVIHGMANEIDGMIAQYAERFPSLEVLFSGGDSPLLQNFIKKRIFAAQNPTLFGLLKILKLNASEN